MKKGAFVLIVVGGWCLSGWTQTATNEVKKPVKPAAETKEPEAKEPEKPRPTFKPKERIPVDQGVDFPADI